MQHLLPTLTDIAAAAGAAILKVYGADFGVQRKEDASPLTEADLAAHRIIVDGLGELEPALPVVSEESTPPPYEERRQWRRYWLVDPLDGTKEFVSRNGEFTVNIALIEDGRPRLGVVCAPVLGQAFIGDVAAGVAEKHENGQMTRLRGRKMDTGRGCTLVASRSHGNERLQRYMEAVGARFPPLRQRTLGSSLKLCLLAAGEADLYPRLGPTAEWDIAAADAVLTAAGGAVQQRDGLPLAYNKQDFLNPDFIAMADADFPWVDALPPPP